VRSNERYEEFLRYRPLNVQMLYRDEPVGLVSGRDIAEAMKEARAIALAANVRNPLTIKGVLRAAKELKAAVMLELAKSEATYCGNNYDNVPSMAVEYSRELGHGVIFALHVDHYAVKGAEDRDKSIAHLCQIISRGWTSVAIDASHNPDYENLIFTRDVAMHIPPYIGLEVEVGEIKGPGELTTVEEALYFVGGLNSWGVFPDFLAISNGSKHGTYDKSSGEEEGIDLVRTREIADAIAPFGVSIAQHGISGTPLEKVSTFRHYGINKGNVGTLWQNILFGLKMEEDTGNAVIEKGSYVKDPDRGIPAELWEEIVAWADSQGMSRKSGDYKKANKPFHDKIMALPEPIKERIVEETCEWAKRFIRAFGAEGTAELVVDKMLSRKDHCSLPQRFVLNMRHHYTRDLAPDRRKREEGADYSD